MQPKKLIFNKVVFSLFISMILMQFAISKEGHSNQHSSPHTDGLTNSEHIRGDTPIVPQEPAINPDSKVWFRPSVPPSDLNEGAAGVVIDGVKK